MKEKIVILIIKLNNVEIPLQRIYLYFNTYLIKSIFFRYKIVKLENKQLKDIEKTHEVVIAKKLNLGNTFSRAILYSRRNVVGIGLIKVETVIVMLVCKLCIGNLRANNKISRLIRYDKKWIIVE